MRVPYKAVQTSPTGLWKLSCGLCDYTRSGLNHIGVDGAAHQHTRNVHLPSTVVEWTPFKKMLDAGDA